MDAIVGNPLRLKSVNHISLICKSVNVTVAFYENVLGFISIMRPGSFDFDGAWLFGYGIGIHLLRTEDPENIPRKNEINTKDNHISFQHVWIPINLIKRSANSHGNLKAPNYCIGMRYINLTRFVIQIQTDDEYAGKVTLPTYSEPEFEYLEYDYFEEVTTFNEHACDESMDVVEKYLNDMKIICKRAMVVENGVQVDQLFFHDPDGFMIEICNCDSLPVIPLAGEMVRSCSRLNLEIMPQQIQQVVKQI